MNSRPLVGSIILASLILLTSCAAPTQSGELISLKIGIGPFTSYAPLFIAKEEGYFEEEGLDVEFVTLPRSGDMIPAISQGDIDVAGIIITTSVLNLIAQGENIRFVADRGYADPAGCVYSAVVARPELADTTPADMAGSKVATDEATYQEFFMEQVLNSGGLSLDDVTIESVVIPSQPELLASGQIDYATSVEPWPTRMEQAGQAEVWVAAQDVIPNFQILYYIFGPTILEDNHGAGVRFMRAYLKAKAQYEEGKTERNVDIISNYTDLDPDIVRASCLIPLRDDLRVDIDSLLLYQAWSIEQGYSDIELSEEDLIDLSFINEALNER